MRISSKQIVDKAWNFSHVLRDDGLSYMAYTEQITFLLFLKMADERAKEHPNNPRLVPAEVGWGTLLQKDGSQLIAHYEHILEALSRKSGMLGAIFKKPRPDIQNPATLRKLIVDLIQPIEWSSLEADVKGDIYEGLLAKSAEESPKGAGQYFTPRELIKAIVECVQPTPMDTVCDPAAGTGGFLLAAHSYVTTHFGGKLPKAKKAHLRSGFVRGWELVPNTARLCIMNLYLHGIESDPCPIDAGIDSLARDPKERFSLVLTNPPFGRRSTMGVASDKGMADKDESTYRRKDFWATTKNKQLNFLQHANTLLKKGGRCAIVVPDNLLFEGGAGEIVRRNLLRQCNVHTLLRLPTGLFYAQGVKANVLFFDSLSSQGNPGTKKLWVYDLRAGARFTLKTKPLQRSDLAEFVACFRPGKVHLRKPTWDEETNTMGRWRDFDYEEIASRDKCDLDISWLSESNASGRNDGSAPEALAQEIADELQLASQRFQAIAKRLRG